MHGALTRNSKERAFSDQKLVVAKGQAIPKIEITRRLNENPLTKVEGK